MHSDLFKDNGPASPEGLMNWATVGEGQPKFELKPRGGGGVQKCEGIMNLEPD